MFGFIKRAFFTGLTILLSVNPLNATQLSATQECKVRLEIVNVNSNEPVFYPFSIKTSTLSSRIDVTSPQYSENFPPTILLF